MNIKSMLALLFAVFVIAGCAGMEKYKYNGNSYDFNDPVAVSEKTVTKTDKYTKSKTLEAPILYLDNDGSICNLTVFKDVSDDKIIIMVMDTYFRDWRFYFGASDSDGKSLNFVSLDREVKYCNRGSCTYNETFALTVDKEYLEKHSASGIEFKVFGKRKDQVFHIPAGYIKGFLNAMNRAGDIEK